MKKMFQSRDLQNKSEKEYLESDSFNEKIEKLNFPAKIIDSMKLFCEKIDLNLNDFINELINFHLKELEIGVSAKNFDLLLQYFNFSELSELSAILKRDICTIEKNQCISVDISKNNIDVIIEICKIIRKVSPKEFIEDAINYQYKAIINNIENGDFEFLWRICTFSKMQDQFKNLDFK